MVCKLIKEKKFTDKENFEVYPSDLVPPQLYGTVKAHKPKKNYRKRTILWMGTPPYGISKYLVKLIQPTHTKQKLENIQLEKYPQVKSRYHMMMSTYIHLFLLTKLLLSS